MHRIIPIITWIRSYTAETLRADSIAGITVGIMLIPQGMAYAMIAGLPPIYGLYAATVPLVIYAILGTSRQLAVGPVAMVSLLVATGVSDLAEAGSPEYISLALALAMMVGFIQFLLGLFRLGFIVNFLSHPVISGFTSAAALIIGISQLKYLLGIDLQSGKFIHQIIPEAIGRIGEFNPWAAAIGMAGILIIAFGKFWKKAFPGPIVVVILSILLVSVMQLDQSGLDIVGTIPAGLPEVAWPVTTLDSLQRLFPLALAIALVSLLESMAVAKAIQAKHKNYKVSANQEFRALGLSNIIGSIFQSYPVTGGFSRTAVNDEAGAKTGMASIISAILVALTLLLLTPLFYYLPKAVLASIIMVAVLQLIDVGEMRYLWRTDRRDFAMLAVTFFATLSLGIEEGIATGVILSLIALIYQTAKPHYAFLGRVPGTQIFRNLSRFSNLECSRGTFIFRFDAPLFFANIDHFHTIVEDHIREHPEEIHSGIISFDTIHHIDSSAAHLLKDLIQEFRDKEIRLLFAGVKGPVRDAFKVHGITEMLGREHFFLNVADAVKYITDRDESRGGRPDRETYIFQNNLK